MYINMLGRKEKPKPLPLLPCRRNIHVCCCRYRAHPEEGVFLLEVSMGAIAGQLVRTTACMHLVEAMISFTPPCLTFIGIGLALNGI